MSTTNDVLSTVSVNTLQAGCHVLCEKPLGRDCDEVPVPSTRRPPPTVRCAPVTTTTFTRPSPDSTPPPRRVISDRSSACVAATVTAAVPGMTASRVARRPGHLRRRRTPRPGGAPARSLKVAVGRLRKRSGPHSDVLLGHARGGQCLRSAVDRCRACGVVARELDPVAESVQSRRFGRDGYAIAEGLGGRMGRNGSPSANVGP